MVESGAEKSIEITMRLRDYCGPGKLSRDSCQVAMRLQCFVYKRLNHGPMVLYWIGSSPKRPKWEEMEESK